MSHLIIYEGQYVRVQRTFYLTSDLHAYFNFNTRPNKDNL